MKCEDAIADGDACDTESKQPYKQMQEAGCPKCGCNDVYIATAELFQNSEFISKQACVCNECGWAEVGE